MKGTEFLYVQKFCLCETLKQKKSIRTDQLKSAFSSTLSKRSETMKVYYLAQLTHSNKGFTCLISSNPPETSMR